MIRAFLLLFSLFFLASSPVARAGDAHGHKPEFVTEMDKFPEMEKAQGIQGIGPILAFRAKQQPFLLVASIIFALAILHTFLAVPFTKLSHKVQKAHDAEIRRIQAAKGETASEASMVSFKATLLHFFGEVEAIFGIWVVVLLAAMFSFYDLATVKTYMMEVNFTEPLFVVIIMAFASTRPILSFAESCLSFFARFGKETPAAWWIVILTLAPLLGSLITEPGAMTIAAMLLAKKFYHLKPSARFAYATIGLLFVNISIGGILTNFAAPPVLMVATKWGLTTAEMLMHFGDKTMIAILTSTLIYYVFFRKEFATLAARAGDHDGDGKGDLIRKKARIPFFITITHLSFMAWTVAFSHYPPLFIGGFLFFLAFSQATAHHQSDINLRGPILVGFFLGGLVIHGGLQGWWLAPIISGLTEIPLFLGATILTSFNDNAAITFLASQVQGLSPELKYAVLVGAVTGGGLTVIANAPNPAGQAILSKFFDGGVSPVKLALGALIPTIIVALCMLFFPDRGIVDMFAQEQSKPETSTPAQP
jgi:Na+/H+ antiporter NhaD/arsenite permease-like protein